MLLMKHYISEICKLLYTSPLLDVTFEKNGSIVSFHYFHVLCDNDSEIVFTYVSVFRAIKRLINVFFYSCLAQKLANGLIM